VVRRIFGPMRDEESYLMMLLELLKFYSVKCDWKMIMNYEKVILKAVMA
jgi:hypothetical protein